MKSLIFPDHSKFELDKDFSILYANEVQTLVAYIDKRNHDVNDKAQVLWVPNDFIKNE